MSRRRSRGNLETGHRVVARIDIIVLIIVERTTHFQGLWLENIVSDIAKIAGKYSK
jgi:hypothetical protein